MSYDSSAFGGNVIQLTAKGRFPPELLVLAGRRAGTCTAGTERCPARCPLAVLVAIPPQREHGHP